MASVFGPLRWLQAYCQQPTYNKVTRCDYDSHSRLLAVGFSLGVLMLFETLGVSWGPAGKLSSNFVLHFLEGLLFIKTTCLQAFWGCFFQRIFMWFVGDVETYLVCDFMLDVYPNKVLEEISRWHSLFVFQIYDFCFFVLLFQ